jgi:methylenetetrahydrofolate reductase (NADPH)
MSVAELFTQKKVVYSFEVFPPRKDGPISRIYDTLTALESLNPDFVSVTYGAGGNTADNSTLEIAVFLKEMGLKPVAHLTCINNTCADVDLVLNRLAEAGVKNILALRGDKDPTKPPCRDFLYTDELVRHIRKRGDFSVSAACYPEGHTECVSLAEDIKHLGEKVAAGAEHLITQLFYDNNSFYEFRQRLTDEGIEVPVSAGIMPVLNVSQIRRIVSLCGAGLPPALTRLMARYEHDTAGLREAGIAYAAGQISDLLAHDVRGIHLYTMNNAEVAREIMERVHAGATVSVAR